MENNQESKESQKDISNKFLDVIFESLQRLEIHERRMFEGCIDLKEYIDQLNFKIDINFVRAKNMTLMIKEFEICFRNINAIVNSDKLKEMQEGLKKIKSIVNSGMSDKKNKKVFPFNIILNKPQKISEIKINYLFEKIEIGLSMLRGKVISSLTPVLYSIGTKKTNDYKK